MGIVWGYDGGDRSTAGFDCFGRSASPPKRGVSRVLPAWMMAEAAAPLVNKDGTCETHTATRASLLRMSFIQLRNRYIDEFGRERQVADAPPPASALRIDASSVKNTLEALKSSSAVSSLLSGGGGGGRDDMRARVAKNMPEGAGGSEQNCEPIV